MKGLQSDSAPALKIEVQELIIERLQEHELIKRYIKLNKEFERRVKEENRERDEKKASENRAPTSQQQKSYQKKRGVERKDEQ